MVSAARLHDLRSIAIKHRATRQATVAGFGVERAARGGGLRVAVRQNDRVETLELLGRNLQEFVREIPEHSFRARRGRQASFVSVKVRIVRDQRVRIQTFLKVFHSFLHLSSKAFGPDLFKFGLPLNQELFEN